MKNRIGYLFVLIGALQVSCKKDPPAPLPFADFFVSNNGCISPCYVYFYDQSLNAVSWHYNFDNNYSSTNADDSALFFNPGIYDVRLTVKNADNVPDSVTKQITVY